MYRQYFKRYLIFIAAFLILHFTGLAVIKMPYIINAAIVFVAVLLAIFLPSKWFLEKSFKSTIRDIGFSKVSFKKIMPGIIISALLLTMYPVLGYILNAKINAAENWQLNLIGLLLTAGLLEEMLFRGFLFGGLRRFMSFKKAVFVSTIVFTIAHLLLFLYFSWPVALLSTLLAAGLSLPLAYLFEKGENTIWSPALVHAAIRTIGMVFTTDERNMMALTATWIITSLVVPYIVLVIYRPFRNILTKGDLNMKEKSY